MIHSEVRMGEAVLMIASSDPGYETPRLTGWSTGQGLYLLVDDVESCYSGAVALGDWR
ncbi:hypothetical protein [Arthrobacter globiformis]|uniref:hypothetical protein n=1 Tax=Arthrobacter globiformis TaxID=1665 RepID=UPI0027D7947D|nr:hypothetical protein [Arthrobacter globiformis]